LFEVIRRQNWELLALTLDLLVPPLSLLGILIVGMFVVTAAGALFGGPPASLLIAAANLVFFIFSVLLAWLKFGREILPGRVFLSTGPLVLKRLGLYGRMLLGRTVGHWVRTDRGGR
jgi:hypothetical protein